MAAMSAAPKLKVRSFAISIDGFGAGPHQDLQNPLGVGGPALFEWFCAYRRGLGMGIVFASHTQEQRDQVHRFIDFLTSRPGTAPELQVLPGTSGIMTVGDDVLDAGSREFDDPLLELLHHHENLSQEEFLVELRQQRRAAEAVS